MTDESHEELVARLRKRQGFFLNGAHWLMGVFPDDDCQEAASMIEALVKERDEFRKRILENCRDAIKETDAEAFIRGYKAGLEAAAKWHEDMFRNKTGEDKKATPEQADKFMSRLLWHSWASAALRALPIPQTETPALGSTGAELA